MAAPFPAEGAGTHYDDTSVVEDVTDIIYQITPEDTPFFMITGDTRSIAVVHEWQQRNLTTRQANSAPEGFTYSFTIGMANPTRITNVTQIFSKEIRVSGTEQAIGHYAISDAFADQMQLRLTEFKTDMEHTLIQGTIASGTATDESRYTEGIIQAITSGQTTYTSFGGLVSMGETQFNDRIQVSWDEGGEPRDVLGGGRIKRAISAFTAAGTKFIAQDEKRTVNTISMYESDFFPVQIHLSRDIPSSGTTAHALLFVDRTMARKAWLRRPMSKRVPETADSMDGVVVSECSLEWGHPSAHNYVDGIDLETI